METAVARRLWTLYEPIHAVTYFAPEVTTTWAQAGVPGFWRGYFAGRAAPLAPCPPEVVEATFFGFAPAPVNRAIPSVWERITPEGALAVRVAGAVAALDAALGPVGPDEEEVTALLRAAAEAATGEGRALFAANAAAPWPAGVRAEMWHATTLLREHRGDGHIAAWVAAGITGLEAGVLAVGDGPLTPERVQAVRGWTPDEWAAAQADLAARGLVDGDGAATDAGRALRAQVEEATDRAALRPWTALGAEAVARLDALLVPVVDRLLATDMLPEVNAIGVPRPA
ncbi:hypothetical protein HC251_12480 [Iamia sp. SCSIO 61187]|uniref:SCO6745 family protein n=1 Tax=Iamia sp. SCSIO 61187 TaxID=2722752 RepID=UPI001C62971F|nr:hypothetical protein [Iamia sp. SCSIO 61187]QYG93166.1 hypothetical protein HC251_12480 [Iamia sp. SCSIO 61187]